MATVRNRLTGAVNNVLGPDFRIVSHQALDGLPAGTYVITVKTGSGLDEKRRRFLAFGYFDWRNLYVLSSCALIGGLVRKNQDTMMMEVDEDTSTDSVGGIILATSEVEQTLICRYINDNVARDTPPADEPLPGNQPI